MAIDLSTVDPAEFYITPCALGTLITASKVKHSWSPEEMHLRSIIVAPQGHVVSSGFPKFFNLGENPAHDAHFAQALESGKVDFVEKIDGSLLIADRIGTTVNWRTRGRFDLGEFEPHARATIAKYPKLARVLESDPIVEEYSLLFEYTGPDNKVVVDHPTHSLKFLALVHKPTLQVHWSGPAYEAIKTALDVTTPQAFALPSTVGEVQAVVAAWKDKEGVVARFHGPKGPMLLKIKSLDYLFRHAVKSRLTPRRIRQTVIMLNPASVEDLAPVFYSMGLDYEVVNSMRSEVNEFLGQISNARSQFVYITEHARRIKSVSSSKKDYVQLVRQWQNGDYASSAWFSRMMLLYDDKQSAAWISILAQLADEAPSTIQTWQQMGPSGFRDMLLRPELPETEPRTQTR